MMNRSVDGPLELTSSPTGRPTDLAAVLSDSGDSTVAAAVRGDVASPRRHALRSRIAQLEEQRRVLLGAGRSEDAEKRWLYEQIEVLQRRIRQLESTQHSAESAVVPESVVQNGSSVSYPSSPFKQLPQSGEQHSVLQDLDGRLSQLRSQMDTLSSASSSASSVASSADWSLDEDGDIPDRKPEESPPTTDVTAAENGRADAGGRETRLLFSSLLRLMRSESDSRTTATRTLLALSGCPESCAALRQAGCVPLLVQLAHAQKPADRQLRAAAARALHNLVHVQQQKQSAGDSGSDKRVRRECRVLPMLERLRQFSEQLWQTSLEQQSPLRKCQQSEQDTLAMPHPLSTVVALMKLSFDEQQRAAMHQLGALQSLAEAMQADTETHGVSTSTPACVTLRRLSAMALTNLTFGQPTNKALLCGQRRFLHALVSQLCSECEDLVQVAASLLRNLSWRADAAGKQALRERGAVAALARAAMNASRESTLKSALSALWNLSAHCAMNKADLCAVEGALAFLARTLSGYRSPSNSTAVVENAGGILRNVSSHIAVREDYRETLRQSQCLETLLRQLRSSSLTVVSNACGTLWNLSARCASDQQTLWRLGAVSLLRSLTHSKHQLIARGSSAALRNLLSARPGGVVGLLPSPLSPAATADSLSAPATPTLHMRKLRALRTALEQQGDLSETCDNLDTNSATPETRFSAAAAVEDDGDPSWRVAELVQQVARRAGVSESELRQLLLRQAPQQAKLQPSMVEQPADFQQPLVAAKEYLVQNGSITASPLSVYVARPQEASPDESVVPDSSNNEYAVARYTTQAPAGEPAQSTVFSTRYAVRDEHIDGDETDRPINYSARYGGSGEQESSEETDQPTDFSARYGSNAQDPAEESDHPGGDRYSVRFVEPNQDSVHEPDDVPTDFSVRYAEGHEEDTTVFKKPTGVAAGVAVSGSLSGRAADHGVEAEYQLRTYATEGTPCLGTPHMFSTAASLLDLRDVSATLSTRSATVPVRASVVTETATDGVTDCESATGDVSSAASVAAAVSVTAVVAETPLVFSRSSSMGSLSSLEGGAAALAEQHSVASEYSRQISGVVSPSELPDSPSEQEQPPLVAKMGSQTTVGEHTPMKKNERALALFTDSSDERPCQFQREGTPPDALSRCGTSLSSLTIDDYSLPDPPCDTKVEVDREDTQDRFPQQSPCADDDEDDDDMIYACIKSAMPTEKSRRRIPTPVISSAVPGQRRLPLPVRVADVTRSYVHQQQQPRRSSGGSHHRRSHRHATSGSVKPLRPSQPTLREEEKNESDGDELLDQMIQHSMDRRPQQRTTWSIQRQLRRGGERPRPSGADDTSAPAGAHRLVTRPPPSLPPPTAAPDEHPRLYAVEGTPQHFSTATSLSDLTVEEPTMLSVTVDETSQAQFVSAIHQKRNVSAVDASTVYATEGTPAVFSRCDSLSDICDDANVPDKSRLSSLAANAGTVSCDDSLSSLSVRSQQNLDRDGEASSETDDMLLERCIISAMPKSRSESNVRRQRRHKRGVRERRSASASGGGSSEARHQHRTRPNLVTVDSASAGSRHRGNGVDSRDSSDRRMPVSETDLMDKSGVSAASGTARVKTRQECLHDARNGTTSSGLTAEEKRQRRQTQTVQWPDVALARPEVASSVAGDAYDDRQQSSPPPSPPRIRRPRIVKPGDDVPRQQSDAPSAAPEDPVVLKAVRGRRKPLYSSRSITPRRVDQQPLARASPAVITAVHSWPTAPRGTKTTQLRRVLSASATSQSASGSTASAVKRRIRSATSSPATSLNGSPQLAFRRFGSAGKAGVVTRALPRATSGISPSSSIPRPASVPIGWSSGVPGSPTKRRVVTKHPPSAPTTLTKRSPLGGPGSKQAPTLHNSRPKQISPSSNGQLKRSPSTCSDQLPKQLPSGPGGLIKQGTFTLEEPTLQQLSFTSTNSSSVHDLESKADEGEHSHTPAAAEAMTEQSSVDDGADMSVNKWHEMTALGGGKIAALRQRIEQARSKQVVAAVGSGRPENGLDVVCQLDSTGSDSCHSPGLSRRGVRLQGSQRRGKVIITDL